MLFLHTPCWTTDSGKRLRRRSNISAFSKVLKHCSVAFSSISHCTWPGSVSNNPVGDKHIYKITHDWDSFISLWKGSFSAQRVYLQGIQTNLTSQKLCMLVLTVIAQGSCDDADLPPNNGLIWKVDEPKRYYNYWKLFTQSLPRALVNNTIDRSLILTCHTAVSLLKPSSLHCVQWCTFHTVRQKWCPILKRDSNGQRTHIYF